MGLFNRKDKEREEQEAAAKKAEMEREAKEAAKQMQENLERRKEEADEKKKAEDEAKAREAEQRRQMAERQQESIERKKAEAVLDTYTVKSGDTLSDIALKYYKSAARDKWMAIYEANKAVIGDDHNVIKPGQELKIPKLD